MSAAKHTPGPWEIHPAYTRVAYVVPADHVPRPVGGHTDAALDLSIYAQEICSLDCPDRHRSKSEMRANACLIAAAPEMHALLLELNRSGEVAHAELLRVLAKVEGVQS